MDSIDPPMKFDRPIAYTPWPPLIEARIQAEQWNVTTRTRAAETDLTVLENTVLTLICMAAYPVFWHSRKVSDLADLCRSAYCYYQLQGNGHMVRELRQQRSCNSALTGDIEMCANASGPLDQNGREVPIFEEYTAATIIENVTEHINGSFYVCQGILGAESLSSSVTLYFRGPERNRSDARILQSGFGEIALTADEVESYIFEVVCSNSDTPSVGCRISRPKDLFTTEFSNGTEIKVSWRYFKCYSVDADEAEYDFAVPGRSNGGSLVERIVVKTLNPKNIIRSNVIDIDEGIKEILLPSDLLYTLRLMTLSPLTLIRPPRLTMDEMTPFGDAMEQTYDEDKQCTVLKSNAERCGIISAAIVTVNGVRAIEMIIKAIRPCNIRLAVDTDMADATADHNGVQILYIDGKLTRTTDFFVSVAELRYFGYTSAPPVRIISASNHEIKCQITENKNWDNDNIICSVEVFETENLVLQCCVPACIDSSLFSWCPRADINCMRYLDTTPLGEDLFHDPNIVANNSIATGCTLYHQLFFSRISKRHNGTYKCAFYFQYNSIGFISSVFRTPAVVKSIDVIVKVPIAPRFMDHMDNATQPVWLHRNMTASTLVCAVTGLPEPTVSWYILVLINDKVSWLLTNATGPTFEAKPRRTYKCIARNFNGSVTRTFPVEFERDDSHDSKNSQNFILISLLVVSALLVPLILLVWRWKSKSNDKRFKELAQEIRNTFAALDVDLVDKSCPLNVQVHVLSYNPKFEIDRRAFSMKSKLLGTGEFGIIYRGVLLGRRSSDDSNVHRANTIVAIKIPKDLSDPRHHRALVDELKIMCRISLHVNVLLLFGACTSDVEKRQLFVLIEYCKHGSLRDYLIENRKVFENFEDIDNTVQIFLGFAYQAANGMEHLAGENIIHRDLALRNLLLTETHIVKIADFGMSRRHESVYRKSATSDVPIPVFWMALESLISHQYTQKSDVWSFGIVLWEMFSCGRRPYPDHEPDATFRAWLRASEQNRLGPPRIVCEEIYDLMRKCWTENPDPRPTFSQCKRQIGQTLETRSRSMYVSVIQDLADAWRNIPPEILARANTARRLPANDEQLQENGQPPEDPQGDSEPSAIQIQQMKGSKATMVDEEESEGLPSDYVTTLDMDSGLASSLDNGPRTNDTAEAEDFGETKV